MEQRQLGRTGLEVSVLSFGCGAVGGLMTRGDPRDQERVVARALELGVNMTHVVLSIPAIIIAAIVVGIPFNWLLGGTQDDITRQAVLAIASTVRPHGHFGD